MTVVTIGIAILIISTVGAILWVKRSESGKQRQMKVLLFALYFWLLVFAQRHSVPAFNSSTIS